MEENKVILVTAKAISNKGFSSNSCFLSRIKIFVDGKEIGLQSLTAHSLGRWAHLFINSKIFKS